MNQYIIIMLLTNVHIVDEIKEIINRVCDYNLSGIRHIYSMID